MAICNDAISLIFFAYFGQKTPAVGREDVPIDIGRRPATARQAETPNYQFGTNYILVASAYW
jgi:hypothetical protein